MSRKNCPNAGFWFATVDIKVLTDKTLTPIDKAVYAVLCVHANTDTDKCTLLEQTIADEAGCSVRAAQYSLKKFEERGIIKRTHRFYGPKKQGANSYELFGYQAPCYSQNLTEELSGANDSPTTCTNCRQNESLYNHTKDSFTRGARLPEATPPEEPPLAFEDGHPVDSPAPHNPEEVYTPENAPEIMKSTAELFLHKTGRQGLTWEEISALRELSAKQYPSRVQKEIDTAVKRFQKRGQPLSQLTMGYIAGSLRYQPTRGKRRKLPTAAKPVPVPECTDEQAEAEMAEIEALQAKFDAEARAHGF